MLRFNFVSVSKLTTMWLKLIIVGSVILTVTAVRAPPPVEVNKCCRIGERLNRNQECSIGDGTDKWWPLIYLIVKNSYFLPHGEAPRFIRPREHKRPNCENPELVLTNIALFSNGSLYLAERNSFIDLADYCVDKDVALVCLPSGKNADSLVSPVKLTKIRKCCGHQSIYLTNDATCVTRTEEHNQIPEQFFTAQNSSYFDLVYGYPSCSAAANNKFVIADQFRENNLNTQNGTYALNSNRVLTVDEFCIEHTLQPTNKITESVFACADVVAVKDVLESKREEVCMKNDLIFFFARCTF